MAAMAARADADVDVDVPAAVVAAAVVGVPPAPVSIFLRCCHRRIPAAPRAGRLIDHGLRRDRSP